MKARMSGELFLRKPPMFPTQGSQTPANGLMQTLGLPIH